jgi:hypothetical protein
MVSEQAASLRQFPLGWFASGSAPKDYEARIDREEHYSGAASGFIASRSDRPSGFGTLMQVFKADNYRGKRVRMTGYLKVEGVETWAGLWMRVDGPGGAILAFDNMQDRPVKGTIGWEQYEVVLDIPPNGVNVSFGVLLAGRGRAWADDFAFEIVGDDVPVTDLKKKIKDMPAEPVNLGFEDLG